MLDRVTSRRARLVEHCRAAGAALYLRRSDWRRGRRHGGLLACFLAALLELHWLRPLSAPFFVYSFTCLNSPCQVTDAALSLSPIDLCLTIQTQYRP